MADKEWGETEKKTESRKHQKARWRLFRVVHESVGSAGKFVVPLSPIIVNLIDYLG